jgi:ATP-binding cassette subfamily C protein
VRIAGLHTRDVLGDGRAWVGLARLCEFLRGWVQQDALAAEAADCRTLVTKAAAESRMREAALVDLAGLLAPEPAAAPAAAEEDALLSACQAVGDPLGIRFAPPPRWELSGRARDPLGSICRTSRVRYRRVALRGHWWHDTDEPLLAFRSGTRQPVALLPGRHGYTVLDPTRSGLVPLTPDFAAALDTFGYQF